MTRLDRAGAIALMSLCVYLDASELLSAGASPWTVVASASCAFAAGALLFPGGSR